MGSNSMVPMWHMCMTLGHTMVATCVRLQGAMALLSYHLTPPKLEISRMMDESGWSGPFLLMISVILQASREKAKIGERPV